MPTDDKTSATDYLVLSAWEAITLLDEAQEHCDDPDVADLLEKAESILISLISEIPAWTRSAGGKSRGNGFGSVGERDGEAMPDQEPFDYRPRGRGSRDP